MTPLCKLLASYDSESSKDWSKKGALNELKSLKEEIFIKAGKESYHNLIYIAIVSR